MATFSDRRAAGRLLGRELAHYAAEAPFVIALPRGGLPVGFEVAAALGAPLDVWMVLELNAPRQPELEMGAVAEGRYVHVSPELAREAGVCDAELDALIARKQSELAARVRSFRGDSPRPRLRGRTVILVDDGIATGGSSAAALGALRREGAKKLVLAVPVGASDALRWLASRVDEIVCLAATSCLGAVGSWYEAFPPVDDEEAAALLELAHENTATRRTPVLG